MTFRIVAKVMQTSFSVNSLYFDARRENIPYYRGERIIRRLPLYFLGERKLSLFF